MDAVISSVVMGSVRVAARPSAQVASSPLVILAVHYNVAVNVGRQETCIAFGFTDAPSRFGAVSHHGMHPPSLDDNILINSA